MKDTSAFRPVQDGADVRLYLEPRGEDGLQPVRRLYWLRAEPIPGGWVTRVLASTVEAWLEVAVPTDFAASEVGDKRAWRLATRFVPARYRVEPPSLGIDAELLGPVTWERL